MPLVTPCLTHTRYRLQQPSAKDEGAYQISVSTTFQRTCWYVESLFSVSGALPADVLERVMRLSEFFSISNTYQSAKQFLTWFIKEIVRGDRFSKAVFLFVLVAICGHPRFLGQIAFLQLWQPSLRYWLAYSSLVGLLFLISVMIGI